MSRALVLGMFVIALTNPATPVQAESDNDAIRDSVVKVYSIRRIYSLSSPWKRGSSSTVSGSGVVIAPNQVLTNYHVVTMSTDISISLNGQSERLSGSVEAFAPGIDLAVITLDEPLPDSITPLEISETTPEPGSKIQVFGYPKGGESLSITEGVVSRIEHVRYKFRTSGLRTQIDAPLNNGNSGGPMIADGKVVGIARAGLSSSNDIGYAIPCEEIRTVLADVEDGAYEGKPQLWLHSQTLESKQMRRWLKMPEGASGVKFAAMPIELDDYPLKMNDVITHIGSYDVNNLGKVSYDDNTQVSYQYAVEQAAKDGVVETTILRDGQEMQVQLPVLRDGRYLLNYMFEEPPSYFVYGPIVLGVAVAEFPSSIDSMLAKGGSTGKAGAALIGIMRELENPYLVRRYDRVIDPGEQLVVVNKLISNRMTRDIRVVFPAAVRAINGHPIPNIRAAAELLASTEDELLVIELEDNRNTTIVLSRKEIEREHDQIMEDNGIVNSASKNLRNIWKK